MNGFLYRTSTRQICKPVNIIYIVAFDEGERYLITCFFFYRGIDYVPRVSIAMPVDFRVWTPSWTGTLSLDSIWTGTRSLDSMCHIASIPFD